jgi:hypothetical protein
MTQANVLASLFCDIEKVLQIELLVFILILLAECGKVFDRPDRQYDSLP